MWAQIGFQDAGRPIIISLVNFHDWTLIIRILISAYVIISILWLVRGQNDALSVRSNQHLVESVWTCLPAIVLCFLALPSLRLLYIVDEVEYRPLSVKVIGNQWYWSYDLGSLSYDSYMINEDELNRGDYRLLEVDNRLVLPHRVNIRALITSADVLHSWRVPRLGIKVDAIPGRINQAEIHTLLPGVYYGRCTEICGANHRFIPIALEIINCVDWVKWMFNH